MGTFGDLMPQRTGGSSALPSLKRKSFPSLVVFFFLHFLTRLQCSQIGHIISASSTKQPAVGALTAANRDLWASDYVHLRTLSPSNAALLDTIHSAAFLLCLDPATPGDFLTTSRFLWHGAPNGLRDRWVDKPVQLIVFDSARAGLMGEHSVMDGTPTLAFMEAICSALADPAFDHGSSSPFASTSSAPVELKWTLNRELEQSIARAEKDAAELIASQAMNVIKIGYGKRAIKAARVSPDAWAQLLVQLAYARLLHARGEKRQGGTYESATTRRFFKGRTEVVRVVTSESDAFVRAMMAQSDDSGGNNSSVENRKSLFEIAAKVHVANAQAAGRGEGVDRHLLGSWGTFRISCSNADCTCGGLRIEEGAEERRGCPGDV
jgi:carnitine O-acetyltransferase